MHNNTRRFLATATATFAALIALTGGFVTGAAAVETAPAAAATTAPAGWSVIERPIQPHTLTVTVALVAPRGTTPSFDTAAARQSVEAAGTFLSRETDGAVNVRVDRVVDWMYVDNDTPCSWTGTLQDWVQPRIGWQRGAGKHLVLMVPEGSPCPDWANGEQGWSIDAGGRTFQPGADPSLLAHELGHNMSLFHASSIQCSTAWDFSTLGAGVPEGCAREEYGNRLDVMGSAYTFNPLPAPTLARIGMLPRTFEPACGAVRSIDLTGVGAAANAREAISFADPRDPNARYWVDFRARHDANIYNYLHGTPWAFKPYRDGIQILRNDPNQWGAPTVLSRPGDTNDHRQLADRGERVSLGGGAWVEWVNTTTNGEGTVDVFVPCRAFESALTAQHSQMCLDNLGWSSADGNPQVQYKCSNSAVQRFAFVAVPGVADTYQIINKHSGKCLDVNAAAQTDGAKIQQWGCNGAANQQFTLRPATYSGATTADFQIVARHSGKCLDIDQLSQTEGTASQQWTCNTTNQEGNLNQIWRLSQ